jgi:hypothetical protein
MVPTTGPLYSIRRDVDDRKSMTTWLCALVAPSRLAQSRKQRPRNPYPTVKHSSRVASGSSAATAKKPATKKKHRQLGGEEESGTA